MKPALRRLPVGAVPTKGTMVLLQGRNESIEKYFETIRELNAMGLLGRDLSIGAARAARPAAEESRRGHVGASDDYERDLETFLEQIVLPDTRLPFFLLAHSTGALVALKAAPRLANRIERMVLQRPLSGLAAGHRRKTWLMIAALASFTGFGRRLALTATSRSRFAFRRQSADSDEFRFRPQPGSSCRASGTGARSADGTLALRDARRRSTPSDARSISPKITVPTVIIAPATIRSCPFLDFQESLAQYFRAGNSCPIPGARHEILQEQDIYRKQALAAIFAFIPGSDADPIGNSPIRHGNPEESTAIAFEPQHVHRLHVHGLRCRPQ